MASDLEIRLKALVVQTIAGDKAAYAALLKAVSQRAQRFMAGRMAKPNDSDDVAQEILLSVHKALPSFDPERAFLPWLAAIMHYRFKDYLRKFYASKSLSHVDIDDVQEFLLQDVTENADEGEYIDQALSQLEGKQKAVIHAMYREELSVKEASAKLNMSVSAVKVTAHRAYTKIRKKNG
jgi:RNA polymerase sigma-70 factor (ECF subfamily)